MSQSSVLSSESSHAGEAPIIFSRVNLGKVPIVVEEDDSTDEENCDVGQESEEGKISFILVE